MIEFWVQSKTVFLFDILCIVITLTNPFHKENIICFDLSLMRRLAFLRISRFIVQAYKLSHTYISYFKRYIFCNPRIKKVFVKSVKSVQIANCTFCDMFAVYFSSQLPFFVSCSRKEYFLTVRISLSVFYGKIS